MHVGSPTRSVPLTETRTNVPPELAWLPKPRRVQPKWTDFKIDGRGLFEACHEYLKAAQDLLNVARVIAQQAHGASQVARPQ